MNLPIKQECGCQGGWWERDGMGIWDQQMQTIMYRMDKQQGPTLQHWELYSIFCDKPYGKEYLKQCIYM